MDNFREEIVVRHTGRGFMMAMYGLAWLGILGAGLVAILAVTALTTAEFNAINLVVLAVSGGATWLLWFHKDALRTDYEYSLTNGEMDFAKVMGNTRRKHLQTLALKSIEQGGPVDSDGYRRLAGGPNVKILRYYLNTDAELFYLHFTQAGVRTLLVFEPSAEMVGLMRTYNRALQT